MATMEYPQINLSVFRTGHLEESVEFYSSLGLEFEEEKHGDGPKHYAAELGDFVFELYPDGGEPRIGFTVGSVDEIISQLAEDRVVMPPKDTSRGRIAVVQDYDGRKIELVQQRPPNE